MKPACQSFRHLLEQKLVGRIDVEQLTVLSWHEHLVGCAACRTLFESEEALEALLATLPEPQLPPHLRRIVLAALARSREEDAHLERMLTHAGDVDVPSGLAADVLARLEAERARRRAETVAQGSEVRRVGDDRNELDKLDVLLSKHGSVVAPEGLSQRILARLEAQRHAASDAEARLDRLLDRDRVTTAHDLSERVLAALERHRDAQPTARSNFTLLRSAWIYGLAASLVAALAAWALWPKQRDMKQPEMAHGTTPIVKMRDEQVAQLSPDAQMLAAMDVLENWDLLMQDDVDVLISTSVDPVDEALLDYVDSDGAPIPEKEPATPSKG